MTVEQMKDCMERTPVIAAIQDNMWEQAIKSPAEIIFCLNANLLTIKKRIDEAHSCNKHLFVHMDLAEGLGRDKSGIEYLSMCGADGIISTRSQLIRYAGEKGLLTVQRFFALDSKGISGIYEMLENTKPDLIEIMPGVITKVIKQFSSGPVPVIAGGLIQTKVEVTEALSNGAFSVSTGKEELWYI